MIKVNGQLKTKVIHGRNGDFTIASLITDIGEFSVKDSTLDQYPEGIYDGEFTIQKIFPYSYSWGGNIKVEIRAMLESIMINEMDEKAMPDEEEPDPIYESTPETPKETIPAEPEAKVETKPKPETTPEKVNTQAEEQSTQYSNDSEQLPKQVKLDPTGDRKQFRAERDRLKELGYKFDPKTQFWNLH